MTEHRDDPYSQLSVGRGQDARAAARGPWHVAGRPGNCCLSSGAFITGPPASLPVFSMASPSTSALLSPAALLAWLMAATTTPTPAGSSPSGDLANLHGFSSVPPKLTKKILAEEYVDMWELLPEFWQVETEGTCCHSKRPRRSLVTDINVWTECFVTMAAILASAFPSKAPHLFAYLRTITKASHTFESSAWASYDMAYRRQAANRGSLDWGVVDAALYNEAFAGWAKLMTRCRYCLSNTHPSQDCQHAPLGTELPPSNAPHATDGRPGRSGPQQPGLATRTCRYLPAVQLTRWFAVQVPSVSVCTCVHEVQTSTPTGGVRREASAYHGGSPRAGQSPVFTLAISGLAEWQYWTGTSLTWLT